MPSITYPHFRIDLRALRIAFALGLASLALVTGGFVLASGYAPFAGLAFLMIASPVPLLLYDFWSFPRLLYLLFFLLSNIGIINHIIAIKRSNGDNLVGIRDLTIVVVIVVGLIRGAKEVRFAAGDQLLKPGLLIVALLPLAALLGWMRDGNPLTILQEMFAIGCGWLLALVIAANVKDWQTLKRLTNFSALLGAIVAAGSMIEILSLNRFQIVSSYQALMFYETLARNWPDGFVYMFATWTLAAVLLIVSRKRLAWAAVTVFITLSFLLTQMRSVILALVIAMVIMSFLSLGSHWFKVRGLIAVGILLIVAVGVTVSMLSRMADSDFGSWAVERYENTFEDAASRLYELEMVTESIQRHPFAGTGLGVAYRDPLPELSGDRIDKDGGTFVHNILAYFLLKLGPLGLVCFLAFAWRVLKTIRLLFRVREPTEPVFYALAICALLLCTLLQGQAGNIFADIRQMPIVSVMLGLLISTLRWVIPSARSEVS
jgi:O-antigen ligase